MMERHHSPRPGQDRWGARAVTGAIASLVMTWSLGAEGAPNAWPFDFDTQLADDPAAVQVGLNELGQGLPGLRDDEVVEVPLGTVSLYLFEQLADTLRRAVTAGPAIMPPLVRQPVICVEHESFTFPSMLVSQASPACVATNQAIAAAFTDNDKTCAEVEFPEVYVFDHPPGFVDTGTVSTFEGLIAVAGEALSHIDYPVGLLPDGFFAKARPIIAKIRYARLTQQLDDRLAAYGGALQQLNGSASCFNSGAKAAFETTVGNLTNELQQAKQHLDQIHQDGLAAAAADRATMEGLCRARNDLPHPSLTDEERLLLSFYIGGIYWRARGAGLLAYPPDPGQGLLRRILYVKHPYQLIGDLTGGVDAASIGDWLLIDENWGWAEWWDMGHSPGEDKYFDLVYMTKRGKRGVTVARPEIEGRGYDIRSLIGGAMQMGPVYYFAWDQLETFKLGENLQDPYMWFIEWPGSLGEFGTGAALAEGLARTMLWGTEIPPDECVPACPGCGGGGAGAGGATSCGPCPPGYECNDDGECVPVGSSSGGASSGAGSDGESADGGCGCSTPGGHRGAFGGIALVVAGLLARRLDRRRRPS